MAFNNGFPATYQPIFQAYPQNYAQPYTPVQTQQQPVQAPVQNAAIIWVQGEAAARGYLMAPNTTLPLWDSESNTIFLKTTDAAGMPSMKVLDYTIRDVSPANGPVAVSATGSTNAPAYATKADVEALAGQLNALRAEMDSMSAKRTTRKKEDADNE